MCDVCMVCDDENEKKELLKKYFFTNMVTYELMDKIGITINEYNELIKEVKKELGLPANYRRTPKRYGKYHKGCYMIVKNDTDIVGYYPTYRIADINNVNDDKIVPATDEELLKILSVDYDKNLMFDDLRVKYQLPYPKLLSLIKQFKKENGLSLNQNRTRNKYHHIYRYPPTNKLTIKKYLDGKLVSFGYYDDYDVAVKVRDYLEKINWKRSVWMANRVNVLNQILEDGDLIYE